MNSYLNYYMAKAHIDELRPDLSAAALLHEPDLRGRTATDLAGELRPPAAGS